MNQTAKHIIFIGRVQGVGFRFTAHNIARRCGLTGFVRNLLDGTVEMVVQGAPDDIDDCIRGIKETYQGAATETKIEEIPLNAQYTDFKITF